MLELDFAVGRITKPDRFSDIFIGRRVVVLNLYFDWKPFVAYLGVILLLFAATAALSSSTY